MNTHDIELPPLPRPRVPLIDADVDLMDIGRLANWCEKTAKDYARAAVEADRKQRFEKGEALQRYKECGADEEPDPIERLRFYCSLAMSGQDWLDAEPFFDAVIADRKRRDEPVADENTTLRIAGCISRHLNTTLDQSSVMAAAGEIAEFTTPQPAEPVMGSDTLNIAYMSGFYDGKKAADPVKGDMPEVMKRTDWLRGYADTAEYQGRVYSHGTMYAIAKALRDIADWYDTRSTQPAESDLVKCAECGAKLIPVRPGKWQHPDCSQSSWASEPVVADAPVPSDDLQDLSDRAYCQYIEQMRRPECLGWEQKVKDGRFGEAELKAHTKAGEFLGRHHAFSEAAALLARYGKTQPAYDKVVDESTRKWKRIEEYSREVDGKKIDIYLGDFLLYCPQLEDEDEENTGVVIGHYSEPYKGWYISETLEKVFPTHFMPLPEKPRR